MSRMGSAPAPGTIGRIVPGWLLRGALAVVVALSVLAIQWWTSPVAFWPGLLAILGTATVIWPQTFAPGAFLAGAAICVLAHPDARVAGWTFLAVGVLHAVHILGGLAGVAPFDTDIERVALRPALHRFLTGQAVTQCLVLAAFALT